LGQSPALAAKSGYLQQEVLVILAFPATGSQALTPAEKTHIINQVKAASNFIWMNSNKTLRVNFKRLTFDMTLDRSDYEVYGGNQVAAKFSKKIRTAVTNRNVLPEEWAGVILIYRPTNAPGGSLINNTWKYLDDPTQTLPGFSSVLFNGTDALSEVIVHEYLHQLDHRFEEAAPKDLFAGEAAFKQPNTHLSFMNPDSMNDPAGKQIAKQLTTVFSDPKEYYKAVLKYFLGGDDRLHKVKYSLLAKAGRGRWIAK
jgi:hypothetical protein